MGGPLKLHPVKRLASGFAAQAGQAEKGRGLRSGKKARQRKRPSGRLPVPFACGQTPASENGYRLVPAGAAFFLGIQPGRIVSLPPEFKMTQGTSCPGDHGTQERLSDHGTQEGLSPGTRRAQLRPAKRISGIFRSPHLSHFLFKCIFVVPHSGGRESPKFLTLSSQPLWPPPTFKGDSFWQAV